MNAGSPAPGTVRHAVRVLLVALLVSVGCVGAGLWQWSRHEVRGAAIALVERNHGAEPVDVGELLAPGRPLAADDVWRPVTVRGTYLPSAVLLRNRPVEGRPGFHVLAPLLVTEGPLRGGVLVVDRGWVPLGEDGGTVDAPSLPAGEVDVVVHLRSAEAPSPRDAPAGQVQAIAPDQVRAAATAAGDVGEGWPADATLAAYGALVSEDGARPAGLGALPEPSRDPGSHLSYAFQWWVFALGALGTGVVLVVRGVRERAAEAADDGTAASAAGTGPAPGGGDAPRPGRARRRPTAEEEEDALLDAQAAAGTPAADGPGRSQGSVRSGSP